MLKRQRQLRLLWLMRLLKRLWQLRLLLLLRLLKRLRQLLKRQLLLMKKGVNISCGRRIKDQHKAKTSCTIRWDYAVYARGSDLVC